MGLDRICVEPMVLAFVYDSVQRIEIRCYKICRAYGSGIIKAHGGQIKVESMAESPDKFGIAKPGSSGEGTTFIIELPVV